MPPRCRSILLCLALGFASGLGTPRAATSASDVAYGNGMFVAVGSVGHPTWIKYHLTSTDGAHWITATLAGEFVYLSGIAFGANTFVAVGGNSIVTSTNGFDWVTRSWRGIPYLTDVLFAQDRFVAVGSGNAILTSPDGKTWIAHRLSGWYSATTIAYGNGVFLAAAPYAGNLVSTDSVVWTLTTTGVDFTDVVFGNGLFMAAAPPSSAQPGIWTSSNGGAWTWQNTLTSTPINRLSFADGRFFAASDNDLLQVSADGVSWTPANTGLEHPCAVTRGAGLLVAAGSTSTGSLPIASSTDGITWSTPLQPLAPPAILEQPTHRIAEAGWTVEFGVTATGNPAPTYEWRLDGVPVGAPPSHLLRLPNVFTNHAGGYSVVVGNSQGSVTSTVATLSVNAWAPVFHSEPASITVLEGNEVRLTSTVGSAPPALVQWRLNDVPVPGETNTWLVLPSITPGQAGPYTLVASNAMGMATSAVATVTVSRQPPVLLSLPRDYRSEAGTPLSFCADVQAGPLPTFRWQHNGVDLPGATASCLDLFQVMPEDDGVYSVVASNSEGSVTGVVATLAAVLHPPAEAALVLSTLNIVEGNRLTLSAYQRDGAPSPELHLQFNGTNLFVPWVGLSQSPTDAWWTYNILELTSADTGEYALVASNCVGTVTSKVERLTVAPAGPLDRWTRRNPQPLGNNLLSITRANGLTVAVGDRGAILTSLDGADWTVQPVRADVTLRDVVFGQNTFVVGGDGGTLLTSTDATHWTVRSSGQVNPIVAAAYGNNRFVALCSGSSSPTVVLTSTDGLAWSGEYAPRAMVPRDLAFGNGLFVASGDGSTIWTSPDGLAWTAQSAPGPSTAVWECVEFSNGLFIVAGDSGRIVVSSDASTWFPASTPTSRRLLGVSYGAGTYVAVGARGVLLTSTDALSWSVADSGTPDRLEAVLFDSASSQFIALGENGTTLTSSNATDWVKRNLGVTRDLDGLVVGADTAVAVGKSGTILTSTNGINYREQVSGTTDNLHGVAFDRGLFVAVGEPGTILTSVDGARWTRQPTGSRASLKHVACGSGLWVAVGTEGTLLSSPDGARWTQCDGGTFDDLNGVAFGNGTFVVVGDQYPRNGTLLTSTDGLNWVNRSLSISKNLRGVAFANDLFVALSNDGGIYVSADGATWTARSSGMNSDGNNLRSATWAHDTWLVAGNNGILLTSTDTVTWTRRASRTLENLHGIQLLGDRFIAIGNRGLVLQSGRITGARLHAPAYDPTLGCTLTIDADPGQHHRLQGSSDLRSWTDLFTFRSEQPTTLFLDDQAPSHPYRFYRVVAP